MSKEKFTLEYDMRNTPVPLLWSYLSTATGLGEWFADDARSSGKEMTFIWKKTEQKANITVIRSEKYVRFHWVDELDKSYFELKIAVSDFSGEVQLIVTDFAEPDEVEGSKELWNSQVETLQRILGC